MGKGSHGKGRGQHPTSNDQRSNSLNPNNPAYHAGQVNRGNQLNPNNPEYESKTDSSADESSTAED